MADSAAPPRRPDPHLSRGVPELSVPPVHGSIGRHGRVWVQLPSSVTPAPTSTYLAPGVAVACLKSAKSGDGDSFDSRRFEKRAIPGDDNQVWVPHSVYRG